MAQTLPPIPYTVVRRRVKYARIELTPQGLRVITPDSAGFDVTEFLYRHQNWIQGKLALYRQLASDDYTLTSRPLPEFKRLINESVALASAVYGAQAAGISYRTMKNRWGSCSSRRELKFNTNLRFLPDNLVYYVAFHEVCHLKIPRHDARFKKLLRSQFPDYKELDRQLLGYWHRLQAISSPRT